MESILLIPIQLACDLSKLAVCHWFLYIIFPKSKLFKIIKIKPKWWFRLCCCILVPSSRSCLKHRSILCILRLNFMYRVLSIVCKTLWRLLKVKIDNFRWFRSPILVEKTEEKNTWNWEKCWFLHFSEVFFGMKFLSKINFDKWYGILLTYIFQNTPYFWPYDP